MNDEKMKLQEAKHNELVQQVNKNVMPPAEIPKREERKRLYIWIPKKLYADLQYRANMADRTLVDYVTDVLTEHIRRDVDEI